IDIYDNAMLVLAIDNFKEVAVNKAYGEKWESVKKTTDNQYPQTFVGQPASEIYSTHLSEWFSFP
ncbi:hypothetical protein, partial [Phocaeicola coprocola]|uniref:hypothetical protein n=1 Tax=Phocaeicola coprocola TaxID=310298 RepID=UPI0026E2FC97